MRKAPLSTFLFYALSLCTASSLYAATITVDASTAMGEINPSIFGYNFDYKWDSWKLWDPSTRALKTSAQTVIGSARRYREATAYYPSIISIVLARILQQ